jgi:Ca2+/H+ antiporter, TMEM165/GDT1 family
VSAIGAAAAAFAGVFPAELPDKSLMAAVVLTATTKKPMAVWLGAAGAFAIHVTIAASAGRLVALAPKELVALVAAALFTFGAFTLWRTAEAETFDAQITGRRVMLVAFVTLLGAEWGDLTQLLTAGLSARTGEPVAVALGAWTAEVSVGALGVTIGHRFAARLPIQKLRRGAAIVCSALAVWSLTGAF